MLTACSIASIVTSTSGALCFFGTSPISQITTGVGSSVVAGGGGAAIDTATTFDGYTVAQVVQSLRSYKLLA
jgi:hypothetical protein